MKAIGAILSAIWFFVKRFFVKRDKPSQQYERERQHNANVVRKHDEATLNADMQRDLDRLR